MRSEKIELLAPGNITCTKYACTPFSNLKVLTYSRLAAGEFFKRQGCIVFLLKSQSPMAIYLLKRIAEFLRYIIFGKIRHILQHKMANGWFWVPLSVRYMVPYRNDHFWLLKNTDYVKVE